MPFTIKAPARATIALLAAAPALADPDTAILRAPAEGLESHTLYLPLEGADLPVLVWGNGSCAASHYLYTGLLTAIAQHGWAVIAVGSPGEDSSAGNPEMPERLIAAIDWVESEAGQAQTEGRADTGRIVAAGHSCGGLEAMLAAADARVSAVLGLNTGFFPADAEGRPPKMTSTLEDAAAITVPFMIVNGGEGDIAHGNSLLTYEAVTAPKLLVSNPAIEHSGLFYGTREGRTRPGSHAEAVDFMVDALGALLGEEAALAKFTGEGCTYCGDGWQSESAGF